LLQSKTSIGSLIYYLLLLTLARVAGARVILLCQGLGPFRNEGWPASQVNRWLAGELEKASYISLRDAGSAEILSELTGRADAPVSADLAFLGDSIASSHQAGSPEKLRVYAILRGSVAEAPSLATVLLQMNEELENFELCPTALQPGEDDELWLRAGWRGNVIYCAEPENLLSGADLLVSMRLHGCIIATLAAVPWIALAYDPKVSAFAESCRWKFCTTPGAADKNYLESKLNQLFARRAEYADRLNRISGEKKRSVEEDYARFKQLFSN
jgi:polysaccharide pyruvyl transferase WcaK-like protein